MRRWALDWWPALVPLALGGLAAVVAGAAGPDLEAYATVPLWAACLLVGIVAALIGWGARSRARAAARAVELAQADARAERDRLLARLDHELKNPLTAARVALANLRALELGEQGARAADSVEEQVLRITALAASLRKLGELSQAMVERSPVQMSELLDELEADLREHPAVDGRSLTFAVPRAPWPLSPVLGDRDLLYLALYNLATNALKFSGVGDAVEVRAFQARDHLTVEVADTGRGIPSADHEAVWEELARARNARDVDGSGLGLALVRSIVSMHAGTVALESREGHGTVVRVELPTDGRTPG